MLDSPSDYAKKGDDIAAVTGGGDAFVTELAKEAATEAARNASEAIFNSRLAQGINLGTALLNMPPPWNSCDRAVATAIRWAGADDTFSAGYTGTQLSYLRASDRWLELGRFPDAVSRDELMPGDVLIVSNTRSSGHIVLYVGYEAAQRAHPGLASDMVQIVCLNLHQICGYGTTHGCQCLCWHGCSDIHRVSECADGGR